MKTETLTTEERDEAATVLVESFRDYAYMRYVFRGTPDDAYDANLEVLVRFIVDARFARQHPVLGIRDGDRLVAVATVVNPDPAEPSAEIDRLFERLRDRLGGASYERMRTYERTAQRNRPGEPFHYLGMLGVAPDRQGAGLGKRLVDDVKDMARLDPASTGVCLNTEAAGNVSIYEHFGFEVVGEADIEDMHTWCMFWRHEEAR